MSLPDRPVRFDSEAEDELTAAATWYEREREGLGRELLLEVNHALERIRAAPLSCSLEPGVPPDLEVRRSLLR